ncbi:copper resistance D family protein [Granulibacter bethesdensis]|uniref:Copper resistance protein D n=1 Tax=Granulibacter bethesdensis (strain ATCC BAA-1260 / CGDNIH1) TaxID=391165 RepID=Q0BW60_GRABC|nr:CopD family protein [Granulibacter bethesdensis]ABI60942.1 Copper resistance protein D [Granulibacter bethesdensis CGDNIH1]APH50707.1 Copper resistance protein D [Granulibacter bethesdensis]APH63402.1 Copper resistance protein D [Granulibacter bethesdensis]
MSLLVDVFGYLSVIIHGLTIVAQSMMLGAILFLALLARPLSSRMGTVGPDVIRDSTRIAFWSALGLMVTETAAIGLQISVISSTVDLPISGILGAGFAVSGLIKIAAAFTIAVLLAGGELRAPLLPLLLAGAVELGAATMTTHAAARIDNSILLLVIEGLHQLGAAIWVGGIPCFVAALARISDVSALQAVGPRFSRLSMAGVAFILISGIIMAWYYIGSWQGFYGTAYGVMVGAKIVMLLMLLALGYGNLKITERLKRDPATPVLRMKRFAEAEIGIGFTLFFAAASLTSVPPAIDLTQDRATLHEIAERNRPVWPRLISPDHDRLALIEKQQQLDTEAATAHTNPQLAFEPGSGDLPPRNAADIAWSEYNHHWAGIFVAAIGVLALLNRAGLRMARHWPLIFLLMAGFLLVRSDPEVWPLGQEGFFASLRDVEVLQHRLFVVLIVVFGLFEWRVRVGGMEHSRAALVFPLLTAVGSALLLTHNHAIANVKEQLLIELTHTPLALTGVLAGWSRWLEIRADGRTARIAGWIWPVCFVLIGLMLLSYREA